MKILHVVPSYWPAFEFGGPIQTVHLLNKFLVKKGIEVTVYTTNAGLKKNRAIPLKKEVDADGVKVLYFPYYGYVHWTFSPALFLALGKEVKKFDLIHITGVWNFPTAAAAFWARFYKKPYIISPRGSLMKEPLEMRSSFRKKIYLSLVARRDLKNASAIHFTAEAEKEEYLKAGLPLRKGIIIPNGFDPVDFQSYEAKPHKIGFKKKIGISISPDRKIVLFLSRLNWKKGLDTLIPAFAEVVKKEPKAVLVLAGPDDENYSKEIKKMIDEINIRTSDVQKLKLFNLGSSQDLRSNNQHKSAQIGINQRANIIFTGMLIGADKVVAYKESDVFVLPSYSENFGQVVVEAMYFGLPVVITKNVGIAPSIIRAEAGLVIDKDEKQLAEAILKILNNPDLAKKMGEQGKRLVETEFSWLEIANRFREAYKNL